MARARPEEEFTWAYWGPLGGEEQGGSCKESGAAMKTETAMGHDGGSGRTPLLRPSPEDWTFVP